MSATIEEGTLLRVIDNSKKHGLTREMHHHITQAKGIPDLAAVAKTLLDRMPETGFAVGIGPMRTGTERDFSHNLRIFDLGYEWFCKNYGIPIFYQLAFECDMHRIRVEKYQGREHQFMTDLFHEFYRPVMHHTRLTTVLQMPDWDRPHGAMHEFNLLQRRAGEGLKPVHYIDITELLPKVVEQALTIADL